VLGVDEDGTRAALPDHERTIEEARFKIAGFGGQGVLLLGLALAEAGMLARRQVSWMPSYGPEMRGGTANCSVTVSDQEIGSPLIEQPTVLVAMNGPSLDRFASDVVPGGLIFYNSSMIDAPPQRDDIVAVGVPASDVATSLGNAKVANMVMLGAMLARCSAVSREAVDAALPRVKMDAALLELNSRALDAGGEAGSSRIGVEAS
jgi:Pyruvate/2-oxoacid:ferredoxin oxidoreductase gamma subunit